MTWQDLPATLGIDGWAELFASADECVEHLELRDLYAVDYEDELWRWWSEHRSPTPRLVTPWWDMIRETVARGVEVHRARVVSLPPSEYTQFLHAGTWQNIEAGESIRWLSRSEASDLLLPGNDFWMIDRVRVMFNLFDGDGRPVGKRMTDAPEIVKPIAASFEAVWDRGTDHAEFGI